MPEVILALDLKKYGFNKRKKIMAMIKHNYPRSQHTGITPVGSTFAPEPRMQGGMGGKITDTWGSNAPPQPNQQQMLAQALRGRNAMPQQQFTEEEKAIIMQLMQQGMSQEQAIQQLMSMKSG